MIPFRSIAKCLAVLLCLGGLGLYAQLWTRSYRYIDRVVMSPPQSLWKVDLHSYLGKVFIEVRPADVLLRATPLPRSPQWWTRTSQWAPVEIHGYEASHALRFFFESFLLQSHYGYQLGFPYGFGAFLLGATFSVLLFGRYSRGPGYPVFHALASPSLPVVSEADQSYANTISHWKTEADVDWALVRDTLAAYLREVVATFSRKHPEAAVYGLVLERGQSGTLSVYLNTEDGYRTMPGRFRKELARSHGDKTDEELLAILGRWSYGHWQFDLYEYRCGPEVGAINRRHYDLFERLSAAGAEDSTLGARWLAACAGAVAMLEWSDELLALRRTDDFEFRLYDGKQHEWDTQAVLEQAQADVYGA